LWTAAPGGGRPVAHTSCRDKQRMTVHFFSFTCNMPGMLRVHAASACHYFVNQELHCVQLDVHCLCQGGTEPCYICLGVVCLWASCKLHLSAPTRSSTWPVSAHSLLSRPDPTRGTRTSYTVGCHCIHSHDLHRQTLERPLPRSMQLHEHSPLQLTLTRWMSLPMDSTHASTSLRLHREPMG
jgi:hypothetical protein